MDLGKYVGLPMPVTGSPPAGGRLFELYDRMLGDVEIPAVLREVADVVCQDLGAQRASIYLIDRETRELESVAVVGNVERTIRVPIRADSLAGYCALSGRCFVAPDAYGDLSDIYPGLRFDTRWDRINDFRTRDVMCAPAVFKDRLVGVVQVINSKGNRFCEGDIPALRDISRLIGYSLYHARLYDDLATMKRLEAQKAEFMRIMVHELKSPVAAGRMLSDALKIRCPAEPVVGEMTAKISGRMDQMIELITDILDFARTKSGEPFGEISVFDLAVETSSSCESYRNQAEQKGLTLAVALPDGPVPVRFDLQGYHLVVSNLVSNAIKYTPAGSVAVTLARDGDRAVLAVRDSGIGVPEADVPRLFREFFRASNAKRSRINGNGVGLAGVKHIVERFGGEMALQTRENEGSEFTVLLPVHSE